MTDYKKMYTLLFAAISDALELLPDTKEVEPILKQALLDAEDVYIETTGDLDE